MNETEPKEIKMPTLKPGYLTSELYTTIIGVIAMVLVALGVISQADADTLAGAVLEIAAAIGTIIGIVHQVREYVYGRNAQKMALLDLIKKRGE